MDATLFYVLVGAVVVAAIARWQGWPALLLVTVVALAASFLPFIPEMEIDGTCGARCRSRHATPTVSTRSSCAS